MKIRKDRITTTEVDRRVSTVAHDVVVLRERLLKAERETARLKAALLDVAPSPVPEGHYVTPAGDVFDANGKPDGILDKGRWVTGVPHECSVNADGDVIPPPGKPWERFGWTAERIGYISEDGQFVDERALRDAEAAAHLAAEADAEKERRLKNVIAHNEASAADYLNPTPPDPRVAEVLAGQRAEHRKFLRDNRVPGFEDA